MPRPPLPKIVTHSLELRARSLRILLEIVREKYPAHWHDLINAARAALGKTETLLGVIERWLRARGLLDEPDKAAAVQALRLLAEESAMRDESYGFIEIWASLFALEGMIKSPLPRPVRLHYEYTLGATEEDDIRIAVQWFLGVDFCALRNRILADFTEQLDAAIAQYKRNCEAAGLVEQPVSPAERERMTWLAIHLLEGRSAAWLAEHLPGARRNEYRNAEAVRKALAAAARACGLRLRRGRGRQKTG